MWGRFAVEATLLGFEAQRVILLRTMAMAAGGARAEAELRRMIAEKLFAMMTGASMLSAGRSPASIFRHVRSRVRANERRLLKS